MYKVLLVLKKNPYHQHPLHTVPIYDVTVKQKTPKESTGKKKKKATKPHKLTQWISGY